MNITDVQIKNVYNDPIRPVKAKVSVVIDKEIILHNIRVIEKVDGGMKKRFIAFPSQKTFKLDENNNSIPGFFDIYHPITSEARVKFESAIYKALEEYYKNNKEEKEV